jgi:hypothetical protein
LALEDSVQFELSLDRVSVAVRLEEFANLRVLDGKRRVDSVLVAEKHKVFVTHRIKN